jgi:hypothetical protein
MAEDNIPDIQIDHVKAIFIALIGGVIGAFFLYGWNKTAGPWLTNAIRPGTAPTPSGNATVSAAVNTP